MDSDDTIIFATSETNSGLLRVSAAGGEPSVVTTPDSTQNELHHVWPDVLPDGRTVLFTILTSGNQPQVAAVDLTNGSKKVLLPAAGNARYVPTGHLVFVSAGALRAVRFDAARLQVLGDAVPIVESISTTNAGRASVSVSSNGTLAYLSGGSEETSRNLAWVDRTGHETIVSPDSRPYGGPRLSSDGGRIVVSTESQSGSDILVHDVVRRVTFPLTLGKDRSIRPMWTPDGHWVLYRSDGADGPALYRQASDGTGSRERLVSIAGDGSFNGMTPDGKKVIYSKFGQATGRDLWVFDFDKQEGSALIVEPGNQGNAQISPDGRWIAYGVDPEGSIYVRPFPDVRAGTWRITDGGSKWPLWSRDGKELFYVSVATSSMMSMQVDLAGQSFRWGTAVRLFAADYVGFPGITGPRNYDVSADGQRFLVIKEAGAPTGSGDPIMVTVNWQQELKRLLPPN